MPAVNSTRKRAIKNFHMEVPEPFHKKVKMMCVIKGLTLKDYIMTAVRERVERDEKRMKK